MFNSVKWLKLNPSVPFNHNMGKTVSASEAIPVYLRNNVAKKPKAVTF